MGISRVSTLGDEAFGITMNGRRFVAQRSEIPISLDTPAKVKGRIKELFGRDLPDLHVHRNRDGSFAVATGIEPSTWPEDESI